MNLEAVLTALLAAAILSSTPLVLAAIGEAIGERAGVLNLGVEGTMLIGGFVAFWTALDTGSVALGLVAGAGAGFVVGGIFGGLASYLGVDQVVLGLGLTLAGVGATGYLFREMYGSTQPLLTATPSRPLSGLGDWLPVVGPALFDQRWFVYLAWLSVPVVHVLLGRSLWGLRARAAGESPLSLQTVGGDVQRVRVVSSSIAGTLQGLGGATLCVVELGFFLPNVTSGAGFLAIALAMTGRLSPLRIGLVALGFGVVTGLDTALQIAGADVSTEFLQMAPYAAIVMILIVGARRGRLPAALGVPFPATSRTR